MKKYVTVKQAADMVGMSAETLRHYDRIGLVKPCRIDDVSRYRYYSEQELIRLRTVELLKYMDLSLKEIKNILRRKNLAEIVVLLKQAEQKTDEKIKQLQYAKQKIRRAYADYEKKLNADDMHSEPVSVKYFGQRVLLLSDTLESATVENLWDYHRHFYAQIAEPVRAEFVFEDSAGIFTQNGRSRLFAVCSSYPPAEEDLTVLPAGRYVCGSCTEKEKNMMIERVCREAENICGVGAEFIIQNIVVTGILNWNYQIQVLIGA